MAPDVPPPPPPPPGSFTNPSNCAVDEPTVLTIDPGGYSGSVSGWLGAAATLAFDDSNLPSFGSGNFRLDGGDHLELLWSVAMIDPVDDEGSFYFYALSPVTDLAVATDEAIGDASKLRYESDTVGPVEAGHVVVWRDRPSGRYVALRVDRLYATEGGERRATCAAVDARWVFAEQGTARFPRLP